MTILLFTLVLLLCSSLPGAGQPADAARQLVVERIEIEGNVKTRPEVILRYLTIEAGDAATPEELLVNEQRLAETHFFKNVDIYTRPGSQKGRLVVVVEVKERRWPYYRFEGGHGDLDGWYIVPVSFCFDNFSGRGHFLDWQWKIGDRVSSRSLHYRHPDIFGGSGYFDADLFGKRQELFHFIGGKEVDEAVKSTGIRIRFGGKKGFYKHAFIAYRLEQYDPIFNGFLNSFFPDDFQNTRIAVLAAGLHADRRDNPLYPLEGVWGALSGAVALKPAGSEENFPKIVLDARIYRRISRRNVFAFRLKAGYAGEGAPFYERFYLGGPYSLRGYPTGRLTPRGWGTKLFLVQSEMRFPFSTRQFPRHKHTAVVYYDAGGLWLPGEVPEFRDLSHSLGFGYRLRLRVLGILRVDFSLPTNKVDENDFRFQVSLGNAF